MENAENGKDGLVFSMNRVIICGYRMCQLLKRRDSRWGAWEGMTELVPGIVEDCSDSCRRPSDDLYFSDSDISSPSRRLNAASMNHMRFLTKCTTMVPPIRAPSYLLLLPSRCDHAYSGATGRPSRSIDISLPSTRASTLCATESPATGGV